VARYTDAVSQASAAASAQIATAVEGYVNAVGSAEDTYNQALQVSAADYQQALQSADAVYQATIAPFQSALANAQQYAAANPNDPEAQNALQQAQQDYDNAVAQASAVRDGAYTNALAAQQTSDASALSNYEATVTMAQSSAQAEIDGALTDYDAAAQSAWDMAQMGENGAEASYISAEASAWTDYQTALDSLNLQQQANQESIASQYQGAVDDALRSWQTTESMAWGEYTCALAAEPNPQAPGARVMLPASALGQGPVQPANTPFTVQAGQVVNLGLDQFGRSHTWTAPIAGTWVFVGFSPQGTPILNLVQGGAPPVMPAPRQQQPQWQPVQPQQQQNRPPRIDVTVTPAPGALPANVRQQALDLIGQVRTRMNEVQQLDAQIATQETAIDQAEAVLRAIPITPANIVTRTTQRQLIQTLTNQLGNLQAQRRTALNDALVKLIAIEQILNPSGGP
jgi:hypothetical protein